MEKTNAAVLTQTGRPLELMSVEIPQLKDGQVLVELHYSGVCHSQLMEARGWRGPDAYVPHLLGHEGSGVVKAIGPGVSKVRPQDKVILGWIKGHGKEAGGCVYHCGEMKINSGGVTTFSKLTVVSENRLVPLPEGLPMDIAVLFGCAIPTGAGIVVNELQPKAGSTIAVFGLGGIGLSALMAATLFAPKMVIAVDVEAGKLEMAKRYGATHIINSSTENPVEAIRKLSEGKGVDYSVDAAGLAQTIEQAFDSVRRGGGLCVFASHPKAGDKIQIDPFELICGKQLRGSWGGACQPDRDIPIFARLYFEGKLPLRELLSRPYKLSEINQALDDLEARKITRAVVEL